MEQTPYYEHKEILKELGVPKSHLSIQLRRDIEDLNRRTQGTKSPEKISQIQQDSSALANRIQEYVARKEMGGEQVEMEEGGEQASAISGDDFSGEETEEQEEEVEDIPEPEETEEETPEEEEPTPAPVAESEESDDDSDDGWGIPLWE